MLTRSRTALRGLLALFAVGAMLLALAGCSLSGAAQLDPMPDEDPVVVAAPGRIEGLTEVIDIGAAMNGVVAELMVDEGTQVRAGQPLARIACDELEAALQVARADAEAAEQALRRVERGSRDEERRVAAARTAASRAELERARQRFDRMVRLGVDDRLVSEETVDQARRDLEVAESSFDAATDGERLVRAPALPEELARAEARLRAADERITEAMARVDRCTITAPLDATVVRRHLHPGEQVSLALPRPIVSLADTSRLRVRAEVDERDLGRVRAGQLVQVTADALGGDIVTGHVVHTASMMGRRTVRTGDPAEKSDRDVLEVIIELDMTDPRLVIDLRVTALFLNAPSTVSARGAVDAPGPTAL